MELNQQQTDAWHRAAALCSRAEKCSGDMLRKLMEWGLAEDEAARVIDLLVEEKYIDDERYARSFVKDKFRFNKWGRVKIIYQLRAKQVHAGIIESALEEIDEDVYRERLTDLLREKNKSVKAATDYDRKAKLIRFAQGRGFELDSIYPVLDSLLKEC
ncbi:regulatory protein RecX [Sunxiuqinia sp. sy24]|uniref:regulatory protein RecX n=1 Tax=Sunxiuqinia sp. sy24 TaxID=3461495 RepID=UPI004045BDDE